MMRLFFDIGNTRLKWHLDEGSKGSVIESGSILYKKQGWSALTQLTKVKNIRSIWVSSVASSDVALMIDAWAKEAFGFKVNWLNVAEESCGVRNLHYPLAQLGVDRWAAVLGASQYFLINNIAGKAAIIIDAGTAVTIDVLTNDLEFQGGVILPGLNMMHDALVGETQGIDSSLVGGLVVPGQNTQQCVNSGVHYALFGAIERLVIEVKGALNLPDSEIVIMLTGGDALLIERYSSLKFIVLPSLVLDGLKCVADASEDR